MQLNDIETVLFANAFVILSSKEIRIRAEGFQFSGGEMENIARKCAMQEIMHGDALTFTDIKGLCKNEKWNGEEKRKIGF